MTCKGKGSKKSSKKGSPATDSLLSSYGNYRTTYSKICKEVTNNA